MRRLGVGGVLYLLAVFAFLFGPALLVVVFSFNAARFWAFPLHDLSWRWYRTLFARSDAMVSLMNSVLVAAVAVPVALLVGTTLALALHRWRIAHKPLAEALMMLPLLIPGLIWSIALLLFLSWFGIRLGAATVVLGHVLYLTAYVLLLVGARFRSLDPTLEDAARSLGARNIRILWRLVLPHMVPAIVASALLCVAISFSDLVIAFFLGGNGFNTLPVFIYGVIEAEPSPAGERSLDADLHRRRALRTGRGRHCWTRRGGAGKSRPGMNRPWVELRGVAKSYGSTEVLAGVDIAVRQGELFSLLGPSGCGKSTILRLIAGFEEPTQGDIVINGRSMRGIPAEDRRIGIVFQNYALFPHMRVADNIAFGLHVRRLPAGEIRSRVDAMLELVGLAGFGQRHPAQLSGGQQQRVALARALVIEPDLLLLDEPLGALDRKLREAMQRRIVEVQRALGVTAIFVTHDQEEALTMSDRLAIMSVERRGVEQIGTPHEIYDQPTNVHVAGFIGRANLWPDTIAAVGANGSVITEAGLHGICAQPVSVGQTVTLSLRPERIRMSEAAGDNVATGSVTEVIFAGGLVTTLVATDAGLTMETRALHDDAGAIPEKGDRVTLAWSAASLLALA